MIHQQSKPLANDQAGFSALVIGGDGQIGRALVDLLPSYGIRAAKTTRRQGEVGPNVHYFDMATMSPLPWSSYDVVIVCAAITNMDECERDPARCELINTTNTIRVIQECAAAGRFVIYLSTNAVFDGSKPFYDVQDVPKPTTAYGRSKRMVEEYIHQNSNINAAVLRLTKVVNEAARFVASWYRSLLAGENILAYTNRYVSPISLQQVAEAVALLARFRQAGVFQLGGNKEMTYYEYAKDIFADNDAALRLLKPIVDPSVNDGVPVYTSLKTHLPDN